MAATLKVKGGTLVEGESLCRTCRHAHIQRGYRQNEEATFCGYEGLLAVKFKIAECTDFLDKTVPTRHEMNQMAYLINIEPNRKRSGFVKPVGFIEEPAPDEDCDELDLIAD